MILALPVPASAPVRDRLLGAALRRFGADGALGATLDDIRRDAGVSVGAVYHHFPDKSALAAALFVDVLDDYRDCFVGALRANTDARDGIRGVVIATLDWCMVNPAEARVLMMSERPRDYEPLRELNRVFFADVLRWWAPHVHYGVLRDLPIEVLTALWLGPSLEYARFWLDGRARRSPREVAELMADAAFTSLSTKPEDPS